MSLGYEEKLTALKQYVVAIRMAWGYGENYPRIALLLSQPVGFLLGGSGTENFGDSNIDCDA